MHVPDDRYEPISVAEAASRLKVSESTVRRMIRDGKLQAERETRPQGEIVRVLWPAPQDVPPPATAPSTPAATQMPDRLQDVLSVALGPLVAALDSERAERQQLAAENAGLRERAARAEARQAAAEVEADRLRGELAEARRPWLRRLINLW